MSEEDKKIPTKEELEDWMDKQDERRIRREEIVARFNSGKGTIIKGIEEEDYGEESLP